MNVKLICNTGPLVALSMIDRIDILRHLFELVAVPEAVHKAILEGGPINAGLASYRKAKWIKVMTLSNPIDPLLRTSLDTGEAAVIGLARELSVNFIKEAFESNYVAPLGLVVDAFEQEFAEKVGIPYAVAVASGTATMHLALRVMGVGPGDEVFASTLTFIGGVTPILFQGATPVFIDSDSNTWTMDSDLLAEELEECSKKGKLPKAVIPTDLYGQCADLDRILELCASHDILVVTDSAETLGAKYKLAADTRRQI